MLATTFFQRPFEEVVDETELIVKGRVGDSVVNWGDTADVGRKIFTYTKIESVEVIRGDVRDSTIQIRELGGEKDGLGMKISGTAEFSLGEEVVVFLHPKLNSDGSYAVKGMMLSKLVVTKGVGGEEILEGPALANDPGHFGHAHGDDGVKKNTVNSNPTDRKMTLSRLHAMVKEQDQKRKRLEKPSNSKILAVSTQGGSQAGGLKKSDTQASALPLQPNSLSVGSEGGSQGADKDRSMAMMAVVFSVVGLIVIGLVVWLRSSQKKS